MAPRHVTQTDAIRELVEKIIEEKRKIEDALELIREYSKQLNSLADDTQQRLIGRS
jgi:chaperonin cofactor prefoldin